MPKKREDPEIVIWKEMEYLNNPRIPYTKVGKKPKYLYNSEYRDTENLIWRIEEHTKRIDRINTEFIPKAKNDFDNETKIKLMTEVTYLELNVKNDTTELALRSCNREENKPICRQITKKKLYQHE